MNKKETIEELNEKFDNEKTVEGEKYLVILFLEQEAYKILLSYKTEYVLEGFTSFREATNKVNEISKNGLWIDDGFIAPNQVTGARVKKYTEETRHNVFRDTIDAIYIR